MAVGELHVVFIIEKSTQDLNLKGKTTCFEMT